MTRCILRSRPRRVAALRRHDVAEHRSQRFVDDGVQKLRMLEAEAGANFGEIVEPDAEAEFARLHLLTAQLAGDA